MPPYDPPLTYDPPAIEIIDQAYVAPLSFIRPRHEDEPGVFDGGVYRSDRSICTLGLQAMRGFRNVPVTIHDADDIAVVPGTHLYGGLLQNDHFGHFLIESLGRLWAAPIVRDNLESIVYFPSRLGYSIPAFVHDTLRLLEVKADIRLVNTLTKFERLIVPNQLLIPSQTIESHPVFIEFTGVLRDAPRTIDAPPTDKLYVSRSKLEHHLPHLMLENLIEENLAREGYAIIHPETLNISDQLSYYNAATQLLFAEGSALHLYALVARPDQHVGIIKRRRTLRERLKWQIEAHGHSRVETIDCIDRMFAHDGERRTSHPLLTILDFQRLGVELRRTGFITDSEHWRVPAEAEVAATLAAHLANFRVNYSEIPT